MSACIIIEIFYCVNKRVFISLIYIITCCREKKINRNTKEKESDARFTLTESDGLYSDLNLSLSIWIFVLFQLYFRIFDICFNFFSLLRVIVTKISAKSGLINIIKYLTSWKNCLIKNIIIQISQKFLEMFLIFIYYNIISTLNILN